MNNRFLDIRRFEDPYEYLINGRSGRGELTEEYYFSELWTELLTNALNSYGKAFSFEVPICTEYELYEAYFPHLFSRELSTFGRRYATGNFKRFQRALSRMPSGITYTKQETCFRKVSEEELEQVKIRFERNEEKNSGKMGVGINGYTILVNVEKSTSLKMFNDNFSTALDFKEKLLREHKAILRECNKTIYFHANYINGNEITSVYVDSKKVHAMPSSEYEHAVYFGRFGMVDLSTPAEIFGFASAMMELAKQEGIIRENARIKYAPTVNFRQEKAGQDYYEKKMECSGISVNIIWDFKKKSTPSLKAW